MQEVTRKPDEKKSWWHRNYSEGSIPRGVLACFLPKSRDIQGKMLSPKVIWNAF